MKSIVVSCILKGFLHFCLTMSLLFIPRNFRQLTCCLWFVLFTDYLKACKTFLYSLNFDKLVKFVYSRTNDLCEIESSTANQREESSYIFIKNCHSSTFLYSQIYAHQELIQYIISSSQMDKRLLFGIDSAAGVGPSLALASVAGQQGMARDLPISASCLRIPHYLE